MIRRSQRHQPQANSDRLIDALQNAGITFSKPLDQPLAVHGPNLIQTNR